MKKIIHGIVLTLFLVLFIWISSQFVTSGDFRQTEATFYFIIEHIKK
ncbi:hypothetical protein HB912_00170 [Listeria aquatica]|uniref:Uncharacterized protein n=1 Tax=Listeria aquatica TaxID=1494960 RepID=A0A841ZKN6_9LIST|nr:hypothetical protein [Listeria aquatica]MBC1520057.1 hypothetical protein [Listeria aquatica]